MTGEKNRFTTQEKLWMLDDATLSTPEHDEMVLWLLNKENLCTVLNSASVYLNNNSRWTSLKEYYYRPESSGLVDFNILYKTPGFWDKLKNATDISTYLQDVCNQRGEDNWVNTWGYTIWNKEKSCYVLDPLKESEYKQKVANIKEIWLSQYKDAWNKLVLEYNTGNSETIHKDISISSEVPIQSYNKFIVGYLDVRIQYNFPIHGSTHFMFWDGKANEINEPKALSDFIEVKPHIKSFGETLRQLKTYQSYLINSEKHTYLFTKDLRFKDAFESQGIHVIDANAVIPA